MPAEVLQQMANFALPNGQNRRHPAASRSTTARTDAGCDSGGTFEQRLPVGYGPIGEIATGGRVMAVANNATGTVSIFDADTLAGIGALRVGGEPTAVTVTDDRAYVSIASQTHDVVSAIDPHTCDVVATYRLPSGVTALAASPDGKRVYAGRTDPEQMVGSTLDRVELSVIDTTAEQVGTIDIGSGPAANIDAIQVDPRTNQIYVAVTDDRSSQLVIVDADTTRVRRVIPVGPPIRDIAYGGDAVYVLTSDRAVGGALYVIDLSTHRVSDFVALGGAPTQLSLSPDEARAYVVDYDRVIVVCALSLEIIDSLRTDARPSCVAQKRDGSQLFVADYSGSVNIFAVESTLEELYTQIVATDAIAFGLQPLTA